MKENIKNSEISKELMKEAFEDNKGVILCSAILKLVYSSKLKGYTIMFALLTCMVVVAYKTAAKTDKKNLTEIANAFHEQFLESLLKYGEMTKKEKEEKPNE